MSRFDFQRRGLLCVVSGPSGSGKTTLCRRYTETDSEALYAVSATTRSPRTGEKNGVDYHFLDRTDFENRATRGEFLEWAEVHGNLYGTLKSEVIGLIESGRDVLMDIDVQGAALVRNQSDSVIAEAFVDIFILPPDDTELVRRLDSRGTESPEQLAIRLKNAHEEMRHWGDYRYTVVSSDRETDFATFSAILAGERCRSARLVPREESGRSHPELEL